MSLIKNEMKLTDEIKFDQSNVEEDLSSEESDGVSNGDEEHEEKSLIHESGFVFTKEICQELKEKDIEFTEQQSLTVVKVL